MTCSATWGNRLRKDKAQSQGSWGLLSVARELLQGLAFHTLQDDQVSPAGSGLQSG